jgi:hypothetical protein
MKTQTSKQKRGVSASENASGRTPGGFRTVPVPRGSSKLAWLES